MLILDLEPLNIHPLINKKQGYKTIFGAVSFILISVLSILASIAFGRELVEKKNPFVIYSEEYYSYPIIKSQEMHMAIGVMFIGGFSIPEVDKYLQIIVKTSDTNTEIGRAHV